MSSSDRMATDRTLTHVSTSTSTAEGHTSLEMNMPDQSTGRGSWLSGPISSAPLPLSAPVTPPPELEHETDNQAMSGIGCLFPRMLPSRPSSLTVGSESNREAPSTPSHASDVNSENELDEAKPIRDDLLETPRTVTTFQTPTLAVPMIGTQFGQMPPLTPDETPTRAANKRAPSPPSAPRPKRARHTAIDDSEDEGYSEAQYQEPTAGPPLQHIQQLTIDLAGTAGLAINPSHNAASESAVLQIEPHNSDQAMPEHYSAYRYFALAIEWFTEEEILEQLSVMLDVYRAFHLDPDMAEEPRARDQGAANKARQTFEAIFQHQLRSDDDKAFLLEEEEEDVLNVFATWIREMKMASDECCEAFEDVPGCVQRFAELSAAPFIRRLVLFGEPMDIDLVVDNLQVAVLPAYQDDGTIEWEFEMFSHEFEQLSIN
ncbi:hypothetical protein QBC40DRAFT_327024 [Triangularia verruculosa]|uniref:Uncharacterized protein n=1 Tax=Triangularia verruculosa TaxID=2587418 RepID=A0AAN7AWP7_9PEZI|nr:hypothetical protein QBC40DRAFT_327024 [Triangularia verruculosa]